MLLRDTSISCEYWRLETEIGSDRERAGSGLGETGRTPEPGPFHLDLPYARDPLLNTLLQGVNVRFTTQRSWYSPVAHHVRLDRQLIYMSFSRGHVLICFEKHQNVLEMCSALQL